MSVDCWDCAEQDVSSPLVPVELSATGAPAGLQAHLRAMFEYDWNSAFSGVKANIQIKRTRTWIAEVGYGNVSVDIDTVVVDQDYTSPCITLTEKQFYVGFCDRDSSNNVLTPPAHMYKMRITFQGVIKIVDPNWASRGNQNENCENRLPPAQSFSLGMAEWEVGTSPF